MTGTPTTPRGVEVKRQQVEHHARRSRTATFLSKITMPFFQALPTNLSRTDKVINVNGPGPLPSAGPYYVSDREPNRLVTLKKNPNYAKDVARKYKRRPAHLDADQHQDRGQSRVELRRGQGEPGGLHVSACRAASRRSSKGVRLEGPLPRAADELRQLHRHELRRHGCRRRAVPQQPAAATGRQLRDRPQGDGRALRRVHAWCRQTSTCRRGSRASRTSTRTRSRPDVAKARELARRPRPERRPVEVLLRSLSPWPAAHGARPALSSH